MTYCAFDVSVGFPLKSPFVRYSNEINRFTRTPRRNHHAKGDKKIAAEMGFLSAADFLATYSPFSPPFTSRLSGTLLGTIRFRTKSCIHFSFTLVGYVSRIMIFVRRSREMRIKLDMKQKIGEIFIDSSWNRWHVDEIRSEYTQIDRESIIRYRLVFVPRTTGD